MDKTSTSAKLNDEDGGTENISEFDMITLRGKLNDRKIKLKENLSKVRNKFDTEDTTKSPNKLTRSSSNGNNIQNEGTSLDTASFKPKRQATENKSRRNSIASEGNYDSNNAKQSSSSNRGKNKTRIFSQTSNIAGSLNSNSTSEKIVQSEIKNIRDKLYKYRKNDYNDNFARYFRNGGQNVTRSRTNSDKSINSSTSGNINDFKFNFNQKNVISNVKRMRTNSERTNNEMGTVLKSKRSISLTDTMIENNMTVGTEPKKIRRRNRRQSKQNGSNNNEEHKPIYDQESENLYINSETLLILDLLKMPAEQHEEFLLDLAKSKKILVENSVTKRYEWSPEITKFSSILLLGKFQRTFTPAESKRLYAIANSSNARNSEKGFKSGLNTNHHSLSESKDQRRDDRRTKVFEDYVNAIVGEDLDEEIKKKYIFPAVSRRQRTVNYFCKEEFEDKLESFAQKCVAAGLGVITEGDIRINAKNNDQAFIKSVDGDRDAFLCTQLVRKHALHGDIVKVFVKKLNSTKFNNSIQNQTSQNQQNQNQILSIEINDNDNNIKDSDKSLINKTNTEEETSLDEIIEKFDDKLTISTTEDGASYDENEKTIDNLEKSILDKSSNDDNIDISDITVDTILNIEEEPIILEKSSKAFVIRIVEKIHNRRCVGSFLSYRKDSEYITFVPRDMKMPHLRIFREEWPEPLRNGQLNNISENLYIAEIIFWKNDVCYGRILHPVGKCGDLESENKAILVQNNLHVDPYDEKFYEMFNSPLEITDKDVEIRKDLRSECIFTIDPLTAVDLDDALSCKKLENGLYEIGVHISDVTHFLEEGSELDELVKLRTTSVYMVKEVFHMLPKTLCLKCSLLPGEDKLAFSVFWLVNENAEIIETHFKKSIINSCTQFAYEHAQKIIDHPDNIFESHNFPLIGNGFNITDVVDKIKDLHKLAEKMREKRFNNGALKINKPKLYFDLHPETGEPVEYSTVELNTANFLIEEFMLLANQSVADYIYKHFPDISILRCHEPPLKNVMQKVKDKLDKHGLILNVGTSQSIHNSLLNLIENSNNPEAIEIILSHLVSKPMARAKYFCSDGVKNKQNFWHYALSIPIYTHFTSPIRRYPDVLVHRVLSAALGYSPPPIRTPDQLNIITAICNEKKYTAKLAGEDSFNLYFMYYIKSKISIVMRAAINEFFSNSFEVILIESGHIIRVGYPRGHKALDTRIINDDSVQPRRAILKYFRNTPQEETKILNIFDEINVEVYVEKFKIKARIPSKIPPKTLEENDKIEDLKDLIEDLKDQIEDPKDQIDSECVTNNTHEN